MLFHDSKDESAWGLALVGVLAVVMAAFLGEVTGAVQPKGPVPASRTDLSAPALHQHVDTSEPDVDSSPYTQPPIVQDQP